MITCKFYKITGGADGNVKQFIGSTTKSLEDKMKAHRYTYVSYKNKKTALISVFKLFDEFGPENCKIALIEEGQFATAKEMKHREAHLIRTSDCVNDRRFLPTSPEERKAKSTEYHRKTNYGAQKRYFKTENGRQKIGEATRRYNARPEVKAKRRARHAEAKNAPADKGIEI